MPPEHSSETLGTEQFVWPYLKPALNSTALVCACWLTYVYLKTSLIYTSARVGFPSQELHARGQSVAEEAFNSSRLCTGTIVCRRCVCFMAETNDQTAGFRATTLNPSRKHAFDFQKSIPTFQVSGSDASTCIEPGCSGRQTSTAKLVRTCRRLRRRVVLGVPIPPFAPSRLS